MTRRNKSAARALALNTQPANPETHCAGGGSLPLSDCLPTCSIALQAGTQSAYAHDQPPRRTLSTPRQNLDKFQPHTDVVRQGVIHQRSFCDILSQRRCEHAANRQHSANAEFCTRIDSRKNKGIFCILIHYTLNVMVYCYRTLLKSCRMQIGGVNNEQQTSKI